ncbi:MAG TPA: hypothetical protein VF331_27755 [Polyangiales bacterium]
MAVQTPDIAVNATSLFYVLNWSTPATGTSSGTTEGYLMRVPIRGGAAIRLAAIPGGGSQGVQGLAATQTAVIFSAARGSVAGRGAIITVPTGGGAATVLASTKGLANALVADEQNVYFVDDEATKSVLLSGGPVQTVAAAVPYSLGIAGQTLYLADFGPNGTVSSVPITGGPVTVLAKDQPGALYPVRCGPDLCWVNAGSGAMSSSGGTLMQLAPGGAPVVLTQGLSEPHALVFDGNNFFVTTAGGGLWLLRIPSAGGTPVTAESEQGITGLALDESCLYWSSALGISSLATSAADVAGQ